MPYESSADGHLRFKPASGSAAFAIVILHGVGSWPEHLVHAAEILAQDFPQAAISILNGFEPFDAHPHVAGRQWFSVKDVTDANRGARIRQSLPRVETLIAEEARLAGVSLDHVAVLGFSQGAMMALHLALLSQTPVAYVGSFAGRITVEPDDRFAPGTTRVFISHGAADKVVPFTAMDEAANILSAHGHAVSTLAVDGEHDLALIQIRSVETDLRRIFPATPAS